MISLRALTAEDLPRLRTWLQDPTIAQALPYGGDQVSEQALRLRLEEPDPDVRELVVLHQSAPVGAARVSRRQSPRGPWGSFEVFLGTEHQGQGLGRALLPPLEVEALRWADASVMQIAAFAENARALHLYREVLGYQEVERQRWWFGQARREVVLVSNQPSFFLRRRVGF